MKLVQKYDSPTPFIFFQLCAGGSTTELVRSLKKRGELLTELQIIYIIYNTLQVNFARINIHLKNHAVTMICLPQAIAYLHSKHCMHRDIKGHNILLTDEADVKVIDFGVSSRLGATMGRRSTSVGTPYWMAPEVSYVFN